MKFQQRLNRYLLGVALGLILVFVMFNGRDWLGWLPQNQVRKRIAAAELSWSDQNFCKLQCYGFSNASLIEMAEKSDVLFSESLVDNEPKEYQLEHLENGGITRLRFKFLPLGTNVKPPVEVIGVEQTGSGKTCDCP